MPNLNVSFHYPKLPLFVRYLAYEKIFIQKAASSQKQKSHCGYTWTPALYCFCRFLDSPCDVNKSNCMLIIVYNYLGTRCMLRSVQYLCRSYRRRTGYLLFPPRESESPSALLRCSQDLGCSGFSVIWDALYPTL